MPDKSTQTDWPAWEQQVAQILPYVLQHSPCFKDPKDFCSLLQVSTAIRTAVQKSSGHCSVVTCARNENEEFECFEWEDATVNCFVAWLPCHSGLVSEMAVWLAGWEDNTGLLVGLQACAAAATASTEALAARNEQATVAVSAAVTAASAAVAEGTTQQQQERQQQAVGPVGEAAGAIRVQPPPLLLDKLKWYVSSVQNVINTAFIGSKIEMGACTAVLRLLPAFMLRQLDLWVWAEDVDVKFCAAVAQLGTLTEFNMVCGDDYVALRKPAFPAHLVLLAQALGELPYLALVNCLFTPAAVRYLPMSLQGLACRVCVPCAESTSDGLDGSGVQSVDVASASSTATGGMEAATGVMDLAHLTSLGELKLRGGSAYVSDIMVVEPCQVVVPKSVPVVKVDGDVVAMGLHSVQHLKLSQAFHLLDASLSSTAGCLECLDLEIRRCVRGSRPSSHPKLSAAAKSLAGLTGLTQLTISGIYTAGAPGVVWCAPLTALQRLKNLDLNVLMLDAADFANLSVLTGLTQLCVQADEGLVDAAAGPVLSCRTGLQDLILQGSLETQFVHIVAQLMQLRSLGLECKDSVELCIDELRVLSPLKQLTSLTVCLGDGCDTASMPTWLADMPCLQAVVDGSSGFHYHIVAGVCCYSELPV